MLFIYNMFLFLALVRCLYIFHRESSLFLGLKTTDDGKPYKDIGLVQPSDAINWDLKRLNDSPERLSIANTQDIAFDLSNESGLDYHQRLIGYQFHGRTNQQFTLTLAPSGEFYIVYQEGWAPFRDRCIGWEPKRNRIEADLCMHATMKGFDIYTELGADKEINVKNVVDGIHLDRITVDNILAEVGTEDECKAAHEVVHADMITDMEIAPHEMMAHRDEIIIPVQPHIKEHIKEMPFKDLPSLQDLKRKQASHTGKYELVY